MMKRPSSTQREEEWKKFLEVMERVHARQPRTKKTPQEQEEKPAREIKEFKKQKARRVGKSHLKADEQEIFEALQALVKQQFSF